MDYEPLDRSHAEGVVSLCRELGWPSYARDAEVTQRALCAPGCTTWVALDGERVVGLVSIQGDGLIQAHLSLLGVSTGRRRRGIARALVERAFREAGGKWLDLVAEQGSEPFYRSLVHQERAGFRLYPLGHDHGAGDAP